MQFAAAPETWATDGLRGLPNAEKPVKGTTSQRVKPRTLDEGPLAPSREPLSTPPAPARETLKLSDSAKPVRAAKVPLTVGPAEGANRRAATAAAPDAVDVQLLGSEGGRAAHADGVVFTLRPQQTTKSVGDAKRQHVSVKVDYRKFSERYGGSYGSRLRLVQLPACALDSDKGAECRKSSPVTAINDPDTATLTAGDVALHAAQPTVLALTAAVQGDTGTYKATSLSPSSSWSTQLNTGDFTWQYPMPTPEVPGALSPTVGLNYSAQRIDGRTTATNNQSSWIGDGFEYAPGFIERRYKPCADDGEKNSDGSKPGDLCWGYDNAFLTFNGNASELVPTGTNSFKLKSDDGTKIDRLHNTALANGDNDGEYWRLTSPDGTLYYFGYNRPSGWAAGKDETNSSWTVPVFGNNTGEPCKKATFAESWCQQTWRWNLDAVVDPRGNLMAYYYDKETNSYGRNLKPADDTAYTRGGYLKRIEYGLRGNFYSKPTAKVLFTSSERCLPQSGVTCAEGTIGDNASHWYDTPWDLNCKAGTECKDSGFSPSFWTRKRLTEVATQVQQPDGTFHNADSWKLNHRWGMADTDYQLLLDSIQQTGSGTSTPITLPKTTLAYTQLANRLDKTGDGYAPFIKSRLSSIADETGGQTDITYSAPACNAANLPTPQTNTTRCFPQYYGGGFNEDPVIHWFNKYVTTTVVDTDRTGGAPDQVTRYTYLDGGAWHWDDDGLTKDKERTWSQWRGYGHVRVRTGGEGGDSALRSQEEHYFLRGMDGDRKDTSGTTTKSVSVTLGADEGGAITDHDAWAGFAYKQVTYDAPGGKILARTVNRPWRHETASKKRDWGTIAAHYVGSTETRTFNSLDAGAGAKWRTTSTNTTFDTATGRAVQVHDAGDWSTAADNECTRTTYATNTDLNILGLTSRVETVAGSCADTPDRSKDVISDVRTAYDGKAYGAAPTKGDATATASLKSHDGTKATYLETGATFDAYGRRLTTTDITADITVTGTGDPVRTLRSDGRTTTTVYTPATGRPTQVKSTTPPAKAGDATTAQTKTQDLDPVRGLVIKETDTNGKVTEFAFDALGRSTKVWLADRRNTQTPSFQFSYTVVEGKPVAVTTKKLDNTGGQIAGTVIYDGHLRERQTQEPGPNGGRILSDVFYDEQGLAAKTFASYYTAGAPDTGLFKPEDALSVETQTRTTYDGLERPVEVKQIAGNGDGGTVLQTTRTIYGGDRTTVIPPVGGTATTTLTDARGQTTELRRHHTRSADSAYDATEYEYDVRDNLTKVTDPAGNIWSYSYDQRGRQTRAQDPAKGTTISSHDDRGQLTSTVDARGMKFVHSYDNLGRRTELRQDSDTGPLRAKWVYDTVTGAKGYPAEATRYEDGKAYTTQVTAYDRLYRTSRTAVVIPSGEGALAGTYQTGTSYKPSGGKPYYEDDLRPIRYEHQARTTSCLTAGRMVHPSRHDKRPITPTQRPYFAVDVTTRYMALGGGNQAIRNNDGTFAFTLGDHQGTAGLSVKADDLALSQRRNLPFGGNRGTDSGTWPGTKGFVGGIDETGTTGLVHLGAREYDPSIGRFISVDPVLDVADSQQMNGYNYANNSPVTLSDPDGLRPIGPTDSPRGDEEYARKNHGSQWINNGYGWYWKNVQQTKIQGHGTVTTTTYIGRSTRNHPAPRSSVAFTPIKPKPKEKVFHGWAMGANPHYNPNVTDDWIERPPLKTWQKIVLGIATGVYAGVVLAPVAAAVGPTIAAACLANPPGCATIAAEIGTGGAAGGSLPSGAAYGGAANAANGKRLAKQLGYEADAAAASSLFTKDGGLTKETIARSMKIQEGTQMKNAHLSDYFAKNGGAEQWGKYATPRMNTPGRQGTFDIHFYRNEVTGEIYYYDYKVKLGGGGRR
ncbi:hypothetical protein EQG64_03340 [Streptomyces sp. S6]|nr:hypothetical protein EQG64_03340 [Streptomyces sp. S6]